MENIVYKVVKTASIMKNRSDLIGTRYKKVTRANELYEWAVSNYITWKAERNRMAQKNYRANFTYLGGITMLILKTILIGITFLLLSLAILFNIIFKERRKEDEKQWYWNNKQSDKKIKS